MTVNGDAEAPAMSRDGLRQRLITSSTKRRLQELSGLQHQAVDECECLEAPMDTAMAETDDTRTPQRC